MPTDIRNLDPNKNYTWDPEVNDWVEERNTGSEKWFSVKKASDISGYSQPCIRKAIRNGYLPANNVGHKYLISENDLRSWVNNSDAHNIKRAQKKEVVTISLFENELKKMLLDAFNAGVECGLKGGINAEANNE